MSGANHAFAAQQRLMLQLRNRTVQRGCDSLLQAGVGAGHLIAEVLTHRCVRAVGEAEA